MAGGIKLLALRCLKGKNLVKKRRDSSDEGPKVRRSNKEKTKSYSSAKRDSGEKRGPARRGRASKPATGEG